MSVDWRIEANGWDVEPRGHDHQQALYLWCRGYRRNTWAVTGYRLRLLVPWGIRNRFAERYTTLRTFEAFKQLEQRFLKHYA